MAFWDALVHPSLSIVGDSFAFLGWLGVPVFVFLSGFGLERKYSSIQTVAPKKFLQYNYRKLIVLLLPAVLFYIVYFVASHNWTSVISSILSLSLLGNIWHLILPLDPSIYWYFGLTWELYIFFLLQKTIIKNERKRNINMIVWTIVGVVWMVLAYLLFPDNSHPLEWVRRNFIGWVPVFFAGICVADSNGNFRLHQNSFILLIESIFILFLISVSNLSFYTWLIVPFLALFFFAVIGQVCFNVKFLRTAFLWIGNLSSYLFVCHPIARGITHKILEGHFSIMVASYLVLSFLLAISFKYVKSRVERRKALL